MKTQHSKLYKAIDEILWKDWDPIGVSKMEDWPTDEYQSYVPNTYNMVISNANRTDIAKKIILL
jgi:hypothetical protein